MSDTLQCVLPAPTALISNRAEYVQSLTAEISGNADKSRQGQILYELAQAGKRLARFHPDPAQLQIAQWAECIIENTIQSNAERQRPTETTALAKWKRETIQKIECAAAEITKTIVAECAGLGTDVDDGSPIESPVSLIAGGFLYGGKKTELSGRPYQMLCALLKLRFRSKSVTQLIDDMELDDDSVSFPDQVIKDSAKKLRVLKDAAKLAGKPIANPLPSTGKGEDLAYKLSLS